MKQIVLFLILFSLSLPCSISAEQIGKFGIKHYVLKVRAGSPLYLVVGIKNESSSVWGLNKIQILVFEKNSVNERGKTTQDYGLREISPGQEMDFELEVPISEGKSCEAEVSAKIFGSFGGTTGFVSSPKVIQIYNKGDLLEKEQSFFEKIMNLFGS